MKVLSSVWTTLAGRYYRAVIRNVYRSLAAAAFILSIVGTPLHAEVLRGFSNGNLDGWEEKSFQGHTDYTLVKLDGETVLHARCDAAASVLYLKRHIDLRQTPWLRWRWRVARTFTNVDERSKQGDDYPARVYVVADGGLLPWRTRAVNYVWASREPKGSDWPNAYTGNAHMVALRSGSADNKHWEVEARNVRQDFKRFYGKDVERIDGVALMTDCDNTGGRAEAWYGDIEFLSQAPKGKR
ncbi:DUF3047 domain-containing protein [Nitrococcus mobilis]|uniref:DUF3047 domain-containing protein n=1 Tax=Nitrococcus mobilis Nb-231 TaxID=314278 RepID=A4BMJ6_9GAMM|nr:DUF3047 domain-containing protein [Nitrococcus mobilis]EAR23534.1 hypothetical protein NB231_16978 [Nitrococcus mobilis Nb-231]